MEQTWGLVMILIYCIAILNSHALLSHLVNSFGEQKAYSFKEIGALKKQPEFKKSPPLETPNFPEKMNDGKSVYYMDKLNGPEKVLHTKYGTSSKLKTLLKLDNLRFFEECAFAPSFKHASKATPMTVPFPDLKQRKVFDVPHFLQNREILAVEAIRLGNGMGHLGFR